MSTSVTTFPTATRKRIREHAFSLFTGVRPSERLAALLLSANVFVLLASYYILKTGRDRLCWNQMAFDNAAANLVLVVLWAALLVAIHREHRKLSPDPASA